MDFFLKVDLIGCFRELNVRKFRKFSPDHFYDIKNRFYDKKTDFRPETRESMTSETTRESMASETTWPRRPRPGGCRDPGSRNRQPAASPRGNGFSVLRIFLTGST